MVILYKHNLHRDPERRNDYWITHHIAFINAYWYEIYFVRLIFSWIVAARTAAVICWQAINYLTTTGSASVY